MRQHCRRCRAGAAVEDCFRAAGPGSGAGGRLDSSPAPEPSLTLACQVLHELHVAGLVQHFKEGTVLCITDASNPDIVSLEERGDWK